jgi:cobalt-zinc-cadmium efflux system protein
MAEEHHHHHTHAHALSGRKIFWVTVLNALITAAEFTGGFISGSLALLSDAVHNLSDTLAIALSYAAHRIAGRPKDERRTYGYLRAEILSAFINSLVLAVLSVFLIIEAVRRFRSPHPIDGTLMITVAAVGLAANLLSVLLLEKDSHKSLNIKSSYLHLLGDTVSSVGVLIGGLVIQLWNQLWVDPTVTLLIALYIFRETLGVIRKTTGILMQSSAPLDYGRIRSDIGGMEHIRNIHHVHSWLSNEHTVYFEAHIEMDDMPLSEVQKRYAEIESYLHEVHGVSHITLQPEVDPGCSKTIFNL